MTISTRRDVLRGGSAAIAAAVTGSLFPWRALAQTTGAFDYYISPTGSDNNPGTSASPWALTALNTKRGTYAGKRVGVLPGTYNCLSLVGGRYTGGFDTPAFSIAGGTASSQTVVQSTVPRGAILDAGANSGNNPNGQPLIGTIGSAGAGAGYITIDGFEIKNCYNRAISVGQVTGAPLAGSRLPGLIVQNNYVHDLTNNIGGANATAITVYSSQGALVQNNYITNLYCNFSRACGIEYWTSINAVTQFNTVISNSTEQFGGIFHKNASQHSNTVRYNYIDMTRSGTGDVSGMTIDDDGDGTTTSTVNNNIIIANNAVAPYQMDVGNFPASLNHQTWYNNTFVGIPNCTVGSWIRFGAPGTIKVYNNIIKRGTTGGRGDLDTNASALALVDYNCYPSSPSLGLSADNSTAYPNTLSNKISSWASTLPASTIGKDAHSVAADPAFVGSGSGAGYYKLQQGSPCVGKGSSNGTTSGSATDMGAWGNGATQVGCNFQPGAAVPDAPVLTVS